MANIWQSHCTHMSEGAFAKRAYSSGEVGGWGRVPLETWGAGVEYHFQEI